MSAGKLLNTFDDIKTFMDSLVSGDYLLKSDTNYHAAQGRHMLLTATELNKLVDLPSVTQEQVAQFTEAYNRGDWNAAIADNDTTNDASKIASASAVYNLRGMIDNINALIASDDVNLDELQEIVDFIKTNKQQLESLNIGNISGLQAALDTKVTQVAGKGLSTNDLTNDLLDKINEAHTWGDPHAVFAKLDGSNMPFAANVEAPNLKVSDWGGWVGFHPDLAALKFDTLVSEMKLYGSYTINMNSNGYGGRNFQIQNNGTEFYRIDVDAGKHILTGDVELPTGKLTVGTTGGVIKEAAAGSGIPVFSFADDADTGIGRLTDDRFSLIAGGNEVVRVNGDNPLDLKLDVYGSLRLLDGKASINIIGSHSFWEADNGAFYLRNKAEAQPLRLQVNNAGNIETRIEANALGGQLYGNWILNGETFKIEHAGVHRIALNDSLNGQLFELTNGTAGAGALSIYNNGTKKWEVNQSYIDHLLVTRMYQQTWNFNASFWGSSSEFGLITWDSTNDEFVVQGGVGKALALGADGADKVLITTAGQMNILSQGSATTPALSIGNGGTGLYEVSDNVLGFATSGSGRFYINTAGFNSAVGGTGALISRLGATATHPVFSFVGDQDTGLGSAGANHLSLIAGNAEVASFTTTDTVLKNDLRVTGQSTFDADITVAQSTEGIVLEKGASKARINILGGSDDLLRIGAISGINKVHLGTATTPNALVYQDSNGFHLAAAMRITQQGSSDGIYLTGHAAHISHRPDIKFAKRGPNGGAIEAGANWLGSLTWHAYDGATENNAWEIRPIADASGAANANSELSIRQAGSEAFLLTEGRAEIYGNEVIHAGNIGTYTSAESDSLQSVTDRGNATTNDVTVANLIAQNQLSVGNSGLLNGPADQKSIRLAEKGRLQVYEPVIGDDWVILSRNLYYDASYTPRYVAADTIEAISLLKDRMHFRFGATNPADTEVTQITTPLELKPEEVIVWNALTVEGESSFSGNMNVSSDTDSALQILRDYDAGALGLLMKGTNGTNTFLHNTGDGTTQTWGAWTQWNNTNRWDFEVDSSGKLRIDQNGTQRVLWSSGELEVSSSVWAETLRVISTSASTSSFYLGERPDEARIRYKSNVFELLDDSNNWASLEAGGLTVNGTSLFNGVIEIDIAQAALIYSSDANGRTGSRWFSNTTEYWRTRFNDDTDYSLEFISPSGATFKVSHNVEIGGALNLTGAITAQGYNDTAWNTAFDHHLSNATFNSGVLEISTPTNNYTFDLDNRYATEAWVTAQSYLSVESDTLQSVTGRGATTTHHLTMPELSVQNFLTVASAGAVALGGIQRPLGLQSDTDHVALAITENTGGESFGIGVDVDGSLKLYNSSASVVHTTFHDNGQLITEQDVVAKRDLISHTDLRLARTDNTPAIVSYHADGFRIVSSLGQTATLNVTSGGNLTLNTNPLATQSWVNSQNFSGSDTLQDVTSRGAGTTDELSVGGLKVTDNSNLGSVAGNSVTQIELGKETANSDRLFISNTRVVNGSDWTTAGYRLQQKVDATWMGWIQFNGNGNNGGISFGAGQDIGGALSVPEVLRVNTGGVTVTGDQTVTGNLTVAGGNITFNDSAANITFSDGNSSRNGQSFGGELHLAADGGNSVLFHSKSGLFSEFVEAKDLYIQNSISHVGDSDTYMQFNDANSWRVVTGGAERLKASNSGIDITGSVSASGSFNGNGSGLLSLNASNLSSGIVPTGRISGSYSVKSTATNGQLHHKDDRVVEPDSISAGSLQFGFTSWANNNSGPWADSLHMRSYTDASGGADNLVMFLKNGIGMRIWQQSFGSASAYSNYADVLLSSNFSNWVDKAYVDGLGVNASSLGGQSASKYARTDISETFAGSVTVQGDLIVQDGQNIRVGIGEGILLYGSNSTDRRHSIQSRDLSGNPNDDIRINSLGGVYINLDSNADNGSSADFVIGRQAGTGTLSDRILTIYEETKYASFSSRVSVGEHLLATGNIYASGTQGFVFGSSTGEGEYIQRVGDDIKVVTGGSERLKVSNSGVDVTGGVSASGSFYSGNGGTSGSGAGVMHFAPGGASYSSANNTINGAIKISLPGTFSSRMIRFTVKVYEYSADESFTVYCGGYPHTSTGAWVHTFATIIGAKTDRQFKVSFANVAGTPTVYIGEHDSAWSFPHVFVTDIQVGYNVNTPDDYNDGWAIGFETSSGAIAASDKIVTDTLPASDWNKLVNKPSLAMAAHNHSASDITSGTLAGSRLSSGTRYNIGYTNGNTQSTRDKLRLYNGDFHTIGMQSGITYGGLADWAMTFQFDNNADRGFWWGHNGHSTAQGAMALTTHGNLTVASKIRLGYGMSDTATPGSNALDVNGNVSAKGTFEAKVADSGVLFESHNQSASGTTQFRIRHSFSHTVLDNLRGSLYLDATSSVYLRYNGSNKLQTTSAGGTLTGTWNATTNLQVGGSTVWHAGNDGAGSGLRADVLESGGISDLNTAWQDLGTGQSNGLQVFNYSGAASNKPVSTNNANWLMNIYSHSGSGGGYPYGHQIAAGDTEDLYVRKVSNGSFDNWRKLLHSGNYASYVVPKTGGTFTGSLTVQGYLETNSIIYADASEGIRLRGTGGYISFYDGSSSRHGYIQGTGDHIYIQSELANGNIYLQTADGAYSWRFQGSDGYLYTPSWINIGNDAGIFSSTNSARFSPSSSTYSSWQISGSKGGYGGIYDAFSGVNWMHDSNGNGGFFRSGNGWQTYWNEGNRCLAVNGTFTDVSYALYVNGKGAYLGGDTTVDGTVTATNFIDSSDSRLKQELDEPVAGLELIKTLEPKFYLKEGFTESGFYADQLPEEAQYMRHKIESDYWGMDYKNLHAVQVKAIQEMDKEAAELKAEVQHLSKEVSKLKVLINKLMKDAG